MKSRNPRRGKKNTPCKGRRARQSAEIDEKAKAAKKAEWPGLGGKVRSIAMAAIGVLGTGGIWAMKKSPTKSSKKSSGTTRGKTRWESSGVTTGEKSPIENTTGKLFNGTKTKEKRPATADCGVNKSKSCALWVNGGEKKKQKSWGASVAWVKVRGHAR